MCETRDLKFLVYCRGQDMNLTLLTFQRYSIYYSSKILFRYVSDCFAFSTTSTVPGDGKIVLYTRVNHNSLVVVKQHT